MVGAILVWALLACSTRWDFAWATSHRLILRILRRIREANENELPADFPLIKPSDVQVLYAKPDKKGVTLHSLAVTDDGDFEEDWPDGFFTEREEDLF